MLIGLGQLVTFFAAPVRSGRTARGRTAPVAAVAAIAASMLLASCGTDAEPATATTITQPNDAPDDTVVDPDDDANRRAKAMQSTGTKSDNDLLRTVESSAD